MGRLLAGILIGAVLGAFGHAWLAPAPSVTQVAPSSSAQAASSSGTPRSANWGNSPFAPASETATAQPVANSSSTMPPSAVPAESSPAEQASSSAADVTDAKDAADSGAAAAAPDAPKVNAFLNDAFSRAIAEDRAHPRSPSQWDEDFTEEPRDPSWATNAEHRLSGYFSNVASRGVTLMGVQCHQTLCEMKLTEPTGTPSQFRSVADGWYNNGGAFGNLQWTMTTGDNGQRYIVAIVRKWPPKP